MGKPLLSLIVVLIFLVGTLVFGKLLESKPREGQKMLIVGPSGIDLGKRWPGERVLFQLPIYNQSSIHELRIVDVETSCSCTVVDLVDTVVAPKEKFNAPVSLFLTDSIGDTNYKIAISWEANDGASGIEIVRLHASVVDLVRLSSHTIDFGTIDEGLIDGPLKASFRILPGNIGDPVVSATLDGAPEDFTAEFKRLDNGILEVDCTYLPSFKIIGPFQYPIRVLLFDSRGPRGEKKIFLTGKLSGSLRVVPGAVVIHDMAKDKLYPKKLHIIETRSGVNCIAIGDVTSDHGFVTCREKSTKNGEVIVDLDFQFSKNDPRGNFGVNDLVRLPLSLSDGSEKTVVVSFSGFTLDQ